MVTVARAAKKSARSKTSTSSSTRKMSRSVDSDDSPPSSSPILPSATVFPTLGAPQGDLKSNQADPNENPFYMHNADHPGLVLVSNRLDETNYDDWSVAMFTALDAKNKLGFIDGSLPRPLESDKDFRRWSRCNSMVKSWLLNAVSPQIYRSILRISDASAIWRDVCGRFHMTNLPRTYNLTQEIQDLRQGIMSLSEYFTQLKILWDQLDRTEEFDEPCTCGKAARFQQKTERAKTVKFLAGLNDSYGIVRRQIIAKKALPSLVEVYNILDQDDSQKVFSNVVAQPAAFHVSSSESQMINNTSADPQMICYVQNGPNKGRPICSFCNKVGHIAERCYRKHGFPPGYKGKTSDKAQKPPIVAAQVTAQVSPQSLSSPQPVYSPQPVPSSQPMSQQALDNMIGNLSKDQLQHFIGLFSNKLQSSSAVNQTVAGPSHSAVDYSGSYQGVDDWKR